MRITVLGEEILTGFYSKRGQKLYFFVAIGILIISLFQVVYGLKLKGNFIDSYAYFGATEALVAGKDLYDLKFLSPFGLLEFIYPPASLVLLLPFHVMPEAYRLILFSAVSIVLFAAAMLLSFELGEDKKSLATKLLILALLLQTFPVKFSLTLGQINMFMLFLCVLGLYLLKKISFFGLQLH